MTIAIGVRPETENILRVKAAERGLTLEEFLELLAESWAEKNGPATPAPPKLAVEWVAEWRAWVDSHHFVKHVADDSRETIYSRRGE